MWATWSESFNVDSVGEFAWISRKVGEVGVGIRERQSGTNLADLPKIKWKPLTYS